ncbi:MAG: Tim44/TimA family putative adaptor protein [Alphaproteobacteria bacterium]|nr:Tim44/TimA family putative adaptor protein [Alphaproteobacteria bacterium]
MHIPIDILLYALIAVILLARLWVLFGTRNSDEPQRPNPFIPPPAPEMKRAAEDFTPPPMAKALPPPASLEGGLVQVKTIDKDFSEKRFLADAREIFTAIVETYATGNLSGIADKMSPALLAHFQASADARKANNQTAQSRIDKIKDADAIAARAEGTQAFVTVKFVSDQENILRDSGGRVIGGSEGKTEEVTDIWTFSRDTSVPDSKWIVVETRG